MKRREFTTVGWAAALALAGLGSGAARAQAPKAGSDYVVLRPPLAGGAEGKIEVVEFFWYGCPHCNRFQPMIEPWAAKLPADVVYRRVPVAFRDEFVVHQRIYYALEALGQVQALHKKVFHAVHVERNPLNKPEAIADFMARQGVDRAKFLEAFNSFGVQTKTRQAKQIAEGYKIDGVPAIGINGRYWTSGALAGSLERSLQVADYLIGQARAGR
ncbi:thiol:disulfide interchange protein DsbA/DsbL [Caldimonas sp.]|uniref:thiol:disulfide interchange protein DsbA/DsbL n=1 Tax=Caldimonas sp. TaxID=2838790 RepID=UPI00391D9037